MEYIRTTILPLFVATLWISISEFVRNEFLLKSFWINHYLSLGLTFPSDSIHGVIWGIWSLLFAIAIFIIAKRFSIMQTTLLSWFIGFVMMWVVIGNLGVLPGGMFFFYGIPLSILESFLATVIIKKFQSK